MNKLENILKQLNIEYERDGKTYKIPTNKDNLTLMLKYSWEMQQYLQEKIDSAIKYIKENSWYCYKDNEENLDRIGIEHILELLGEDENE